MAHGDIYPAEQAEAALADWFRIGNLCALRELALLWLAAKLAEDRQRYCPAGRQVRERVVVALPGGPEGARLIRRAARITAQSSGDLLAVHVAQPGGQGNTDGGALNAQRRLVKSAGGTYHQLRDDDIAAALLTFAHAENATQLVLGATRRSWWSALLPKTGTQSRVLRNSAGIDVHIVTCTQAARKTPSTAPVHVAREENSGDRTERCFPGGARLASSAPM